jgi:hypothetical protein
MKYVKMPGLAAVATALMALVGASTASATALCTNNSSSSTCSWKYTAGTTVKAQNESSATITTSFKNIECTGSQLEGTTSNSGGGGEAITVVVSSLNFTGCNCEVKTIFNGTLSISWEGGFLGSLVSNGAEITASCSTIFGTVHCIYATNGTHLGTLFGGSPARISVSSSDIPRLTTNALCDESADLDASYKVTSPNPLYVTSA